MEVADLSRARWAPPARRCRRTATAGSGSVARRWTAQTSGSGAIISGGTDFAGAFVGGQRHAAGSEGDAVPLPGRGRGLEAGRPRTGRPLGRGGELVCTSRSLDAAVLLGRRRRPPLPRQLLRHVPGVWRHGDWIKITARGGAIIYGRSDATINRHGIRMGTSELYRGGRRRCPRCWTAWWWTWNTWAAKAGCCCSSPSDGGVDAALTQRIKQVIREALSAPRAQRRHPGGGHSAHAVRQEDGAAGEEAAGWRGCRQRASRRRHGQRRQRGTGLWRWSAAARWGGRLISRRRTARSVLAGRRAGDARHLPGRAAASPAWGMLRMPKATLFRVVVAVHLTSSARP